MAEGRATPVPGVLDDAERGEIEAAFGVDSEQVVRDHIISHALAAISSVGTDDVIFFGGTALARTHLIGLRLSEDIDLIARGDRSTIADKVEDALARRRRRSFGAVTYTTCGASLSRATSMRAHPRSSGGGVRTRMCPRSPSIGFRPLLNGVRRWIASAARPSRPRKPLTGCATRFSRCD